MKELIIYEFEAKHIEDTLRIIANILRSKSETTAADRSIMKSIKMINRVIAEKSYDK